MNCTPKLEHDERVCDENLDPNKSMVSRPSEFAAKKSLDELEIENPIENPEIRNASSLAATEIDDVLGELWEGELSDAVSTDHCPSSPLSSYSNYDSDYADSDNEGQPTRRRKIRAKLSEMV